jgi:hypothetical protein
VSSGGELRAYIRFQLGQLSARNAAHEFEHLAFDLARVRVASNLLPATGPVQAGGDQGRDFESYRTYLAGSTLANFSFSGLASEGIIVGACTLDKKIVPKIKSDLHTIFASGERPTHVFVFCESDLAVYKRHILKEYCKKNYGASLDIFDGQAIADMLADRDTSWIADKYLQVPSELWPATSLDQQYTDACDRWLVKKPVPQNYADFLEIKQCLRTATFEDEAKRDLSSWIEAMRRFIAGGFSDRLVQKARYEISVAELRGRGSLNPAMPLVESFLATASCDRPAAELLDAAVLTVYVWGSRSHGESSVTPEQVKEWVKRNDKVLESALVNTTSRGDRCLLLEARAMTAFIPRETDSSPGDWENRFFDRWQAFVDLVRETPLFPITHVADIFETASTLLDPNERLRSLISQLDALVANRAGKAAAADRARRRATNYLRAGRHVAAIDELHHTKADWYSGENIGGSILAMLLLSQSYDDLGLHAAARYYAAGALFTALNVDNDRTSKFISQAAFRVAETFYLSGDGITYIYSLSYALEAHHGVASDPHDWTKHPQVQSSFAQAVILRAIARRMAPHMVPLIDDGIASWPLPQSDQEEFRAMSEKEPWSRMTAEEIEGRIASDLGQHPFSDVGAERSVVWSAFGIIWTVRCPSESGSWLAALELAAAIQIAQVEFADTDLLIIPSRALIDVRLGDETRPRCVQLPDNGKLSWEVSMPRRVPTTPDEDYQAHLIGVVVMVLGQATALPFTKLNDLVEKRMERGLPGRVFSVRPLRELMEFARPTGVDFAKLKSELRPNLHAEMKPNEAKELCWRTGPGPGYSRLLAERYLGNRYKTTAQGLRLTLPRIVKDDKCRALLLVLRAEGYLDWQLLAALLGLVAQWQIEAKFRRPVYSPAEARMVLDRARREELDDDTPFDLSELTEERIRMQLKLDATAAFKTWGLACHRQTPDFIAMKRFLDERYHHSADDIAHPDPLTGDGSAEFAAPTSR